MMCSIVNINLVKILNPSNIGLTQVKNYCGVRRNAPTSLKVMSFAANKVSTSWMGWNWSNHSHCIHSENTIESCNRPIIIHVEYIALEFYPVNGYSCSDKIKANGDFYAQQKLKCGDYMGY